MARKNRRGRNRKQQTRQRREEYRPVYVDDLIANRRDDPKARDLLQAQLAPWEHIAVYLGVASVAAGIVWLVRHFFGVDIASPTAWTVATVLACGTAFRWMVTHGHAERAGWRVRLALNHVFSIVWIWWAIQNFGWMAILVLLIGVVLGNLAWWQANRIHWSAKFEEPAEQPVEEDSPLDRYEYLWVTNVEAPRKALPGAYLFGKELTEVGPRYGVQLVEGEQTFEDLQRALPKISSGLGVRPEDLMLEPHPSNHPAQALLTILERSPIKGKVLFDRIRYNDGLIEIGPFADGEGEATYRLWTPGGGDNPRQGNVWSGVIIGDTGTGKSRLVEAIAINAMASGCFTVWFIDPKGGMSSPALRKYADWFVPGEGAGMMLQAAMNVCDVRGWEASDRGETGFEPTPERPGLLIIMDECHKVLAVQELAELCVRMATTGRSLGVGFLFISQYAGLNTFGGYEALRQQVLAGNAIVLHTSSRGTQSLMAGLAIDPLSLPKIPGYAYVQAGEETGGRTAPFRNRLVTNPSEWMEKLPRTTLDDLSAKAAGDVYLTRHDTENDIRLLQQELLEKVRSGELSFEEAAAQLSGEAEEQEKNEAEGMSPEAAKKIAQLEKSLPVWTEKKSGTSREARHKVLEVIRNGHTRKGAIQSESGFSESYVRVLLNDLQDDGLVNKVNHGTYELTEKAETELEGAAR